MRTIIVVCLVSIIVSLILFYISAQFLDKAKACNQSDANCVKSNRTKAIILIVVGAILFAGSIAGISKSLSGPL